MEVAAMSRSERLRASQTFTNLQYAKKLVKSQAHFAGKVQAWKAAADQAKQQKDQQDFSKATKHLKINVDESEAYFVESRQLYDLVEKLTPQVSFCARELRTCYASLGSNLQVCERRLELRASRPPTENIEDTVQRALASEAQIIKHCMSDLETAVQQNDCWCDAFNAIKVFLRRDLSDKRQAFVGARRAMRDHLKVDNPSGASRSNSPRSFSGENPPSPKCFSSEAAEKREVAGAVAAAAQILREQFNIDTGCVKHMSFFEEQALALCKNGQLLKQQTKDHVDAATWRTEESLLSSMLKLADLKSALNEQISEATSTIKSAEQVLKQVNYSEDVELTEETEGRMPADWHVAVGTFSELKSAEERLREDLGSKTASLQIDQSCRALVADAAHKKLQENVRMQLRQETYRSVPHVPTTPSPRKARPRSAHCQRQTPRRAFYPTSAKPVMI